MSSGRVVSQVKLTYGSTSSSVEYQNSQEGRVETKNVFILNQSYTFAKYPALARSSPR